MNDLEPFVANEGSNNISDYRIVKNGALTPVAGSPFPAGKAPFSVAVGPKFCESGCVCPYALEGTQETKAQLSKT